MRSFSISSLPKTVCFLALTWSVLTLNSGVLAAEVRVWFNTSPNHMREALEYLENRLPSDITVHGIYEGWQGSQTIENVAEGKYDLVIAVWMESLIGEELLSPLDTQIARELSTDQHKYLMDFMQVRGRVYDFPIAIDPMVVIFNRDMFDEANISYPQPDWTWLDFQEKAAALTKDIDSRIRIFGAEGGIGLWETIVCGGVVTNFPMPRKAF